MTDPNADGPLRIDKVLDALSGYAIYTLDPEGEITSWNKGAERLKGYAEDEVLGQSFSRFFTLEDRRDRLPDRLLHQAGTAGRTESEGWRVRKDGSRFWALTSLQALRDEAGALAGYVKITRDTTQQREAHQALVESERRFRYLVEGVVDYAICMLDVNGVVTDWNQGAQRIKGYAAADIVGKHFSTFYTAEDRDEGRPAVALARARKSGRFEGEGWRVRKDGSRFYASVVIDAIRDDAGQLIGFAKITRDISERKAAEDALAQSERQFRLLVNSVVDYALYMLDPNGIITNWNVGAERIKGYSVDEIVGQHFSRFYTPTDRAAGEPLKALNRAAEDGRYETEAWRVRKDGTQFWANVVIDRILDERGQLVGFAKITRDITDKRLASLELQRAHEQIAQSQKMEALGQLTGGVAHDFNNLLMVVSGSAQLLRKRLEGDERAARALDGIEAAIGRGESLTRHLLSFSRRQRLDLSVASMSDRIESIRELVAASLPPTITLTVDAPQGLWPVEVDQGELDLALLNLAVNARDAMPGGGALTIRAENTTLPPDLDGEDRDAVAILVEDTGAGIPPDLLPRIFEPFFTTKEVGKGTGLGLSQVFGFARQAGGDVRVESQLGEGTRFTLLLPRSQGQDAGDGAEGLAADGPPAQGVVLLVEDNPDVAEVAAALLEQLGHKVRIARDAKAALALLQEFEPDILFSDIVMAGDMDGLALARIVRERHPDLPVLLATGYSHSAERAQGEFPILAKPYKLEELGGAINQLLARAHAIRAGDLIPLAKPRRTRRPN